MISSSRMRRWDGECFTSGCHRPRPALIQARYHSVRQKNKKRTSILSLTSTYIRTLSAALFIFSQTHTPHTHTHITPLTKFVSVLTMFWLSLSQSTSVNTNHPLSSVLPASQEEMFRHVPWHCGLCNSPPQFFMYNLPPHRKFLFRVLLNGTTRHLDSELVFAAQLRPRGADCLREFVKLGKDSDCQTV